MSKSALSGNKERIISQRVRLAGRETDRQIYILRLEGRKQHRRLFILTEHGEDDVGADGGQKANKHQESLTPQTLNAPLQSLGA